ncbi:hypothetical protein PMIT1323_00315 [Prochlorococcus marinus str. MIT 1323]|nr:hypothetical protein PMIT1323_00315 [Prochlorococcus marinus str. MIT 1323]
MSLPGKTLNSNIFNRRESSSSRLEHSLDGAQKDDQVNPVVEMLQAVVAIRTFLQAGLLEASGMKRTEVDNSNIEGRAETQSQIKRSRP